MAGPGGGARGGGGGRGGSFGGGRPGGFGGGRPGPMPHGGFHRPPPHMFYGRRHRYYGGGCLGGIFGLIFMPLIFILIAGIALISTVSNAYQAAANGGIIEYNEEVLQDYADARYAETFGHTQNYEDHILIAVLVDAENYQDYCYIAWVGDHIATSITDLFGGNNTQLGQAMDASINYNSYKYSLDSNLAAVIERMQSHITGLTLDSSFKCNELQSSSISYLDNRSTLSLTESTVNDALQKFTDSTNINIVIVVDEMEDVFARTMPGSYVMTIAITLLFVVIGIWMLISAIRSNRRAKNSNDDYPPNQGHRYH